MDNGKIESDGHSGIRCEIARTNGYSFCVIRTKSFELHHLGQCLFQFFPGFGIRIEQQIQVIFN